MSLLNKQLIVFFTLAYLISWTIWLPLYLPAFGLQVWNGLPFQHALGGFGPLLAAFITTAIFQKKKGLIALLRSVVRWRPILYVLIAFFSPFLLNLLAASLSVVINNQALSFSGWGTNQEFPNFNWLSFFLYNLLFFGFGEETGWRGFVLPRLQSKYNALTSSLLLSIGWASWHWPLFLYRPGYVGMDLSGIFGWLFSLITGSVLLSWLFNSSRGSILVCAIFHATVDIAFTSGFSSPQIVQYMGILITIWGLATIFGFKVSDLSDYLRVKAILK